MKRHTLTTTIEILGIERQIVIEFGYVKGSPAQGPAYSHGGLPAEPAEVDILDVMIILPNSETHTGATVQAGAWVANLIQEAVNEGHLDIAEFEEVVRGN